MEKLFEMTDKQYAKIIEASKPTPVMYLSGGIPMGGSPQENANNAWKNLAEELGFKWDSVRPCNKGNRFFYAEVEELTVDDTKQIKYDYAKASAKINPQD